MRFEIVMAPEAVDDLRGLRAPMRATVRSAIERHLRRQPTKTSKSRIKRLRGCRGRNIARASATCGSSMT